MSAYVVKVLGSTISFWFGICMWDFLLPTIILGIFVSFLSCIFFLLLIYLRICAEYYLLSVERLFDLLFCFVLVSFVSTVLVWLFLILNVALSEAEFIYHSDEDYYVVEIEPIYSMELLVSISI